MTNQHAPAFQKVTHYLRLADRASERHESRRTMEWKTNFGLWALFGGASAVALTSQAWTPHWGEAAVASLVGVGVSVFYAVYWLPYLAESFEREAKIAYFWETSAVKEIDREWRVPHSLRPQHGTHPSGRWPDACEHDFEDDENKELKYLPKAMGLGKRINSFHRVQKCEIFVTLLFALTFSAALFSKALHASPAKPGVTVEGVTIQGDKLHIK